MSQLAATLVAISLIVGAPVAADASPTDTAAQRLTSLVRGALERSELPPLAPGVRYAAWIGTQRTELDSAGLEQLYATSRRTMTSLQIRDFTVHAADCGPDVCWIRYRYRFAARVGASEVSGASENQEFWVRDGERLLLAYGIARQ